MRFNDLVYSALRAISDLIGAFLVWITLIFLFVVFTW